MPRYETEITASRLTPGQFVETTWQGTVAAKEGDYLLYAGNFKAVVPGAALRESGASYETGDPQIDEPLIHGATTVSGTTGAADAMVEVFVNDVSAGTTQSVAGVWSLTVDALEEDDVVVAIATEIDPGATPSDPGDSVTVVRTAPPVLDDPITDEATEVTGTNGADGPATITVYVDDVAVGTDEEVDSNAAFTVSGLNPLQTDQVVTATATTAAKGTSEASAPVTVTA